MHPLYLVLLTGDVFLISCCSLLEKSNNNPASAKRSSSKPQPKQEHFIQPKISPPSSASDNDSVLSDIELDRTPSSFFIESLSTEKKHKHPGMEQNSKSEKQKENNSNSKVQKDKKPQMV